MVTVTVRGITQPIDGIRAYRGLYSGSLKPKPQLPKALHSRDAPIVLQNGFRCQIDAVFAAEMVSQSKGT